MSKFLSSKFAIKPNARVLFVTGTDTGVGKTAVTALLLEHALRNRVAVRALKPFSTGDGGDESLLAGLQGSADRRTVANHSTGEQLAINFFNFPEPLAPWSAARLHHARLELREAAERIREHMITCDLLLVEGAGGLLTPLGERFSAADLIAEFEAEVIVVAPNRLGVLNHALLTVQELRRRGIEGIKVALVELAGADLSRKTNFGDLRELLEGVPVTVIPFLKNYQPESEFIRAAAKKLKPELSALLRSDRGKKNPPDTEAEGTFP